MGYINLNKMNKIWKSRNIRIKLKINLYDAIVLPTVLYGAEVWVLKEYENKKLLAFETTCLKRIMGIRKTERFASYHSEGKRCIHENKQTFLGFGYFVGKAHKHRPI